MASTGKKGKKSKTKGTTVALADFLAGENDAGSGQAIVLTPRSTTSWADEMENETSDALDGPGVVEKFLLPTAPRAARGPDIDEEKLPKNPPYTAHIANLPYDIENEDVLGFFQGLQIASVRIPREGGDRATDTGRIRGFGYVEFKDRHSLIEALSLNDMSLKNRKVRISLAGGQEDHDRRRPGATGGTDRPRDDRPDRTLGDWRSGGGGGISDAVDDYRSSDSERRFTDRPGFETGDRYADPLPRENSRFGDRGGFESSDRYERPSSRDSRDGKYERREYGFRGRDTYSDRPREYPNREFGDRDRFNGARDRDSFRERDNNYRDRGTGSYREQDSPRDRDAYRDRETYREPYRESGNQRERPSFRERDNYREPQTSADGVDSETKQQVHTSGERDDNEQPETHREQNDIDSYKEHTDNQDKESEQSSGSRNNTGFSRERRADGSPRESQRERPRLVLKPRTVPLQDSVKPVVAQSSIFGGAKPVDTASKEREIEKRRKEKDLSKEETEPRSKYTELSRSDEDPRKKRGPRRDSGRDSDSDRKHEKGPNKEPPRDGPRKEQNVEVRPTTNRRHEDRDTDTVSESGSSIKEEFIAAEPPKVNAWAKRAELQKQKEEAKITKTVEIKATESTNEVPVVKHEHKKVTSNQKEPTSHRAPAPHKKKIFEEKGENDGETFKEVHREKPVGKGPGHGSDRNRKIEISKEEKTSKMSGRTFVGSNKFAFLGNEDEEED